MAEKSFLDRIAELEELDVPTPTIEDLKATYESELGSSSLRKKLGELEARWRDEAEPAIQRVSNIELAPKRKAALEPFGIDYDTAPKYLRSVFDSIDPKKLDDADFVAKHLQENDIAVSAPNAQVEDQPAAAGIVAQSLSSPLGNASLTITPKNFASWDPNKQRKFIREHPDRYETLLEGKPVAGVSA
jgi:hypothetical protein